MSQPTLTEIYRVCESLRSQAEDIAGATIIHWIDDSLRICRRDDGSYNIIGLSLEAFMFNSEDDLNAFRWAGFEDKAAIVELAKSCLQSARPVGPRGVTIEFIDEPTPSLQFCRHVHS